MHLQMILGRLTQPRQVRTLFSLCWIAYFTTYLGRLSYGACLVEITASTGWSKGEAGLIATGFFTVYGLSQLLSGIIGDKLSPKLLVTFGLGGSGLINLLFPLMPSAGAAMALWCLNGSVQSMIWSPLIRMLSERLPEEKRLHTCANMNSTAPAGTLAVYGMSATLVYFSSWKAVFYLCGLLMVCVAMVWFVGITRLEQHLDPTDAFVRKSSAASSPLEHTPSTLQLAVASAVPLCCVALLMQGMLKDGVTTWIPTFLGERFGLTASAAILSTTIVPLINLGGVYLAIWLNHTVFRNELRGAACFFLAGSFSLGLLLLAPSSSALVSLLLLATATTFMMGVNTLLVSMLPSYYVNYGKCATISGILNTAAYLGSALSSYLNGAIAESYGWTVIMRCWLVYAVVGLIACLVSIRRWKNFRQMAISGS